MAGVLGIEPSSGVLETLILPMNYTPMTLFIILYIYYKLQVKIKTFLNMIKEALIDLFNPL